MQLARQSTGGGRFRISDPQRIGRQSVSRPNTDPTLALDLQFALDAAYVARRGPLPTFTRASTATWVNSSGVVVSAAINEARLDYNPTTLVSLGLKIEPQVTNLLLRSQEFDNASWTKTNSSITADAATSPDGTANADKLVEDSTSNTHIVAQSISATNGTSYTVSVYLKAAERSFALLALSGAFPTTAIQVNLGTGAVSTGTGTPLTAASVAYINGWYRVSFTLAATSTASGTVTIHASQDGVWANRSYLGDGASGILVWGAQIEAVVYASSYIPTAGSTVVRSADLCTITGGAFSGIWNALEGALAFKAMKAGLQPAATPSYLGVDDATAGNRIILYGGSAEAFNVNSGGAAQVNLGGVTQVAANTTFGMAIRYKANDFALSLNGGSVSTDVAGSVPNATQMLIGQRLAANFIGGWIRSIQYYNLIKTNAQLQTISTP